MRVRAAQLSRQLVASARVSEKCQLLASIPGVGAVTASSFVAAIEDPANFSKSRSVGAWIGLTTKRYQSGEVDYDGHISRCGDNHLRGLLYEAAVVILTRATTDSALRIWETQGEDRLQARRRRRCAQTRRDHAHHAQNGRTVRSFNSCRSLRGSPEQRERAIYRSRPYFGCAEPSLSGRGPDHSAMSVALPTIGQNA